MTPLEKVRKVREVGFGTKGMPYILTESEAAVLLSPEPSKTAEELGRKMAEEAYEGCDEYFAALIQSALDAYAKAKVEEAAERYCKLCPDRDEATDGVIVCESDWEGDYCPKLAAILGREVGE